MRISVKVKTKAKENKITPLGETNFNIAVKDLPIEGRANAKIIELFAEYFKISKTRIKIVSGLKSKKKIVEIK
jgi:hypothetical protein